MACECKTECFTRKDRASKDRNWARPFEIGCERLDKKKN